MNVRNDRSNSARKNPRPTSSNSPRSDVGTPVLSGSPAEEYAGAEAVEPPGSAERAASSAGCAGRGGGVGGFDALMGVLPRDDGCHARLASGDTCGEYPRIACHGALPVASM